MGSQEFQNAYNRALTEYNALRAREAEGYNRLAGLAGVGGTTAQQLTSAGQSYGTGASNVLTGMASNIGNLMVGQGQTAANAALARGSAYGGALNQLGYIAGRYYGQQQPTGYGGGYGGAGVISGLPAYAVMPD
jgi:regulator of protease activity HflC (stomatin/prohibitin superfamily)